MKQHSRSGLREVLKEIHKEAGRQAGWRRCRDEFVDQTTRDWGQEFVRQIFGGPRHRRRGR